MRYKVDDTYIHQRDGIWWYNRRIPKKYAHLDTRGRIRKSLETRSDHAARILRDLLVEADDKYWLALSLLEDAGDDSIEEHRLAATARYESAHKRALAAGFTYQPISALATTAPIEDTFDRLLEIRDRSGRDEVPKAKDVEALLGSAPEPVAKLPKVTEAFRIYVDEIAFDEQKDKSAKQQYSWEKTKKTSVKYFTDVIGDVSMDEITREMALSYRSWWIERMIPGDGDTKPASPNTANRHIGNMRTLYEEYFVHLGDEERQNPFRRMHFKDNKDSKVPSFPNEWVREKVLQPGMFDEINPELRAMIYILIETGARISEICNLLPEQIKLDSNVPHIEIRAINRELKTITSRREIPLVGVALEAMRKMPGGFPSYRDKGELVSANLMKAFRHREMFPTPEHVMYSFRHAFEDRMKEADIDYEMRCYFMGHKTDRPDYGNKGSMEYRQELLLKIAHPFKQAIFDSFDG